PLLYKKISPMLVPAVVLCLFATPGGAPETIPLRAVVAVHLCQLLTGTEPVAVHRQRNMLQNRISHGRFLRPLQRAHGQWRRNGNGLAGQNTQQVFLFGGKARQGMQFMNLDKKCTALGLYGELLLGFMLVMAVTTYHRRRWKQLPALNGIDKNILNQLFGLLLFADRPLRP